TPQAHAAGLNLHSRPTDLVVLTDGLLLERILRNLIANAVRYTRTGGIIVAARKRGADVRVEVIDTGVGIAAADQERIFAEFVQLEGHASAHPKQQGHGMGLGLAIVRRLCSLLEHRLTVHSVPRRGSRFAVTLPRAPMFRVRPDRSSSRERFSELPGMNSFVANRRVVVIDDDVSVIQAMEALFTTWGAHVISGDTAESALHDLERTVRAGPIVVDLIVADLRLRDGVCGVSAVQLIRRRLGFMVPALIISGDTSDAARAQVTTAGIELLPKPLMAAALLAAAKRVLVSADESTVRPTDSSERSSHGEAGPTGAHALA
ncbi:MAG: ATP-binding protein, partial [Pseudomonadota bacterium]|nr:ATP-binding protein [Pseudomonadota bacterium]